MVRASDRSLGSLRLTRVTRALREPWSAPGIARELRDGLEAGVASGRSALDLETLTVRIGTWIDVAPEPDASDGPDDLRDRGDPRLAELDRRWAGIAGAGGGAGPGDAAALAALPANEELLQALSEYVASCHDALDELAPGLTDADWSELRSGFPDWCEAWYRSHFPNGTISREQAARLDRIRSLAQKVDRARLVAVSRRVARLAAPAFLATLGKRVARCVRSGAKLDGFSGDVIAFAGASEESRVVLLGAGKTTVSGRAALVIDLGGDDVWKRAAVVDGSAALVGVVLELGGDDVWASDGLGPAYAAGGIALLVDAKGRDEWTSGRLGQGASACGFAALIDLAGDDRYVLEDYGQGFTFCGIGLLLDRAGDDEYRAWAYAQGAGCGNGFAACVDGGGDDRYVANGRWPDVYGDSGPDSFHGASQGYCTGFRANSDGTGTLLPGGIAALIDAGAGADEYESGNFSQGGGYWYAFGLMCDGGGDDVNRGYRYSQGFGVHQAVGVRWDAGGDDRYLTRCAANCGAGWDEGVGWLLDDSGDDQYEVGGLALGGTANSAVAILVDGGGKDRYGGGGGADSQGGSGDSSYHQFQAIGALIDLGGGEDAYSRQDRGNDRALTGEWFGIFVDAKEKSVEKLLDAKLLKKMLAAGSAERSPSGPGRKLPR